MKLQLLFISLLYAQALFGQIKTTSIGIITPEVLCIEDCLNSLVKNTDDIEVELYHAPNLVSENCLIIEKKESEHFGVSMLENTIKKRINFRGGGFISTRYKRYSMEYYEAEKGFLKVKLNNTDYWIKQESLTAFGYSFSSWESHFKNKKPDNLAVIYNLNLRTSPDVSAEKIMLIKINRYNKDFYHLMRMTGNFQGNWAEVEVNIWKNEEEACVGKIKPQKITGWVKYLDNKGFPNVFGVYRTCC